MTFTTDKIFGLIGRRLGHSYSPMIHELFGCGGYRLIELEPEELRGFFADNNIGGVNVTIPYKKDVMPLCDCLSPEAEEIGCVNTIASKGGRLCGFNTDIAGLDYMIRRSGIDLANKKVIILGSGGASQTAWAAAEKRGASEIFTISRGGDNNYNNLSRHADARIIINTTPVGMYPNTKEAPVGLESFPRCEGVLDLIYNPRRTALIQQARQLGIPCSDGLPMLVAQAKAAQEIFTDKKIADSETERILKLIGQQTLNIVLIGMPGCGKSAIGAALASLTGRQAVDIDECIVKTAGRPIPVIFREGGESQFRRMEREQTALAGKRSGCIIMTGGGAVKDERNYPSLHQNGRIYHIIRDLSQLERGGRPLSADADLEAMYRERLPMYERFRDAAVKNDTTPEDAAGRIWRDFCENTGY